MEHNWRQKTLENLEKDIWVKPDFGSHVVKRCYELRKVPLNKFTIEDIRLMIGQQIGLKYLILLAIDALNKDIYSHGDLYPGDLLKTLLFVNTNFWEANEEYWKQVDTLVKDKRQELIKTKISTDKFYSCFNFNKRGC